MTIRVEVLLQQDLIFIAREFIHRANMGTIWFIDLHLGLFFLIMDPSFHSG
jgi:hypothetical protein